MTLVEERPAVSGEAQPVDEVRRSPVATWRFAARLARREVRRRPGRSILVALLIAVPVMAMTAASVLYRSYGDDWDSAFTRMAGAADMRVWGVPSPPPGVESVDLADVLPDGSRVLDVVETWTWVEPVDGERRSVRFTDLDLTDPLTDGMVEVQAGRAPRRSGEVLLDGATARAFGVDVGDTLRLDRPSGDWSVVGIGRTTERYRQPLVVAPGFDVDRLRPDTYQLLHLVDLPVGADTEAVGRDVVAAADIELQQMGYGALLRTSSGWYWETDARALAWGWVAGAVSLVAVGIVIASAFATSARRQLVTIGHLSANGASPRLVRRSLSLQGWWTGAIGAMVGVALGLVAVYLGRPLAELVIDRSFGGYSVQPFDLAVIVLTAVIAATIAAAVPARSAAGVPVLSALAGRRPLGAPSRRLVPIGTVLFAGGLALLFVAATGTRQGATGGSGDVFAAVALAGGIGVLFGMCCMTPLVVAAVGRLGGSSARGTWRLAARSTARVRTRSAGVVTAIGTAAAIAVGGATAASTAIVEYENPGEIPRNVVYITQWDDWWGDGVGLVDPESPEPLQLDADVRGAIERVLPDATWIHLRSAVFDPRPFDAERGCLLPGADAAAVRCDGPGVGVVADQALADWLHLSAAERTMLDDYDVLQRVPVEDGADYESYYPRDVVLTDEGGDVATTQTMSRGPASWIHWSLISLERAEALGLDVVETGALLVNPTDLTQAQLDELHAAVYGPDGTGSAFVEPQDPSRPLEVSEGTTGLQIQTNWPDASASLVVVNALIIAGAVLLTLLIVAMGLALSATESREERDVLVAVGAPPRTLSRVAGAKAAVLAGTGVVLGVPTGFLPVWVVFSTFDTNRPLRLPWAAVGIIVVAVPLLAGLAAWGTSAIARRARPVTISTSYAD